MRVEVFEEAAHGVEVLAGQVDDAVGGVVGEFGAGFDEVGTLDQESLVG